MAEFLGPSRRVKKTAGGTGKKQKRFLEKNVDALELAQSIAGVQEEKSTTKAEKHHQAQAGQPNEERKPRASAAKLKLKEAKALLAAQKKERTKKRKHRSQGDSTPDDGDHNDSMKRKLVKPARKSVSFA